MSKTRFLLMCCVFCVITPVVFATSYQIFPTLAYENAAALNAVKSTHVILGSTYFDANMEYSGVVGEGYGTAISSTDTFYPYLRVAYRIGSALVAAFDMTHPVLANIAYPENSLVSPVAIDNIIKDTNYSPKFSYQLTPKIALGLGFDANSVSTAKLSFNSPPNTMVNRSSGWSYGWDAGLSFLLNQYNNLNISYYSKINFGHLTGTSTQGAIYKDNFNDNLVIPTTFTLNLLHRPTSSWTIVEVFRYMQWSQEKSFNMVNSAMGNLSFPLDYNDTWSALVETRYLVSEKLGASIVAEYSTDPQSGVFRPIVLPATSITLVGGAVDYALSSEWNVKLQYAYLFANPSIHHHGPPFQSGDVKIGVNIIDLGIAWKT